MAGPPPTSVRPAALLLTGGASRRMGRDKATLVVAADADADDGERAAVTLAERTANLLLAVADPVLEVGPGYTALPRTREHPPGSGPLSALAAGAAALGSARPVLVVATDLPCLTGAFLQRLADHPVPTVHHCVVPLDREGRAQVLCARYSPTALVEAERLVAAGQRSMRDLLDRVLTVVLVADTDSAQALRDVDTPADLAALHDGAAP